MENTINGRIKEIREFLEMTQIKFAQNLAITSANISKIEKRKTTPSEALIKLICKEYDVNEQWLKFGEGDVFNATEEIFEDLMETATTNFSKLLRNSNKDIRMMASELDLIFTEITDIEHIDNEEYKIKYLENTKAMFLLINEMSNNIKKYIYSNQNIIPVITQHIKEIYKKNMDASIEKFFE